MKYYGNVFNMSLSKNKKVLVLTSMDEKKSGPLKKS